jgi:dihydrofolate reductase
MRKLISHMHLSLDGYAAGPGGEMDWIRLDDALFDFVKEITDTCDTALYGRVTWNLMDAYWPTAAERPGATKHDVEHAAWYNSVDKVVISKSLQGQHQEKITFAGDDIAGHVRALKAAAGKDILLLGSPSVVRHLMPLGLIDAYWIFVNPVVLGGGIAMFPPLQQRVLLQHKKTKEFTCGATALLFTAES